MQVIVGRIGRAHGIRGELAVEVRTDSPEVRFAVGANLTSSASTHPVLTIARTRWHNGRLLVTFKEIGDRTVAEQVRGAMLSTEVDPAELPDGDGEFYDHQLVGLSAELADGTRIGVVAGVAHLPGQDLLEIDADGREVLIPFVMEIVPVVDLESRRIVVEPPEGLLEEQPGTSE